MDRERLVYEEENNALLSDMIEHKFFSKEVIDVKKAVELIITPDCNQKCEYCYLQRHGDKLYPKELRNTSQILKNEEMVLNYLLGKKHYPPTISLFSGEIWGTKFSRQIIDLILKAVEKGLKIKTIDIPTNASFLMDDKKTAVMEGIISDCNKVGIRVSISISVDGICIDDTNRPFVDKKKEAERNEVYYEKVFAFAQKHDYLFHPMIAAGTVEQWKENYLWWQKHLLKHNFNPIRALMMLEVRNNDWTDEKIDAYIEFLDFMMQYDLTNYYNNDAYEFSKAIFIPQVAAYRGYKIISDMHVGCSITDHFSIRLGDLAIVPCHRTSYAQYLYGFLKVEDGEITGITANNIQLANMFWFGSLYCYERCNYCPIKLTCTKQCFGAQYEEHGEIMVPVDSVCNLYKKRQLFLYAKFCELGYEEATLPRECRESYRIFKNEIAMLLNNESSCL